jgi:hypothetical protein
MSSKARKDPGGCHPQRFTRRAKKNYSVRQTCYPDDVLEQLRQAYNRGHPQHPIRGKTSYVIWKSLRQRLDQERVCPVVNGERCWLSTLSDETKTKLQRYVFAPPQPAKWKQNKNEWLDNMNLLQAMEQYETTYPSFAFFGPAPMDFAEKMSGTTCVDTELCTLSLSKLRHAGKQHVGIILNLDDHDQGGSHWVALYLDLHANKAYYFDSTGEPATDEVKRFVKTQLHLPLLQNHPLDHQQGDTECGIYVMYFLVIMLTGGIDRGAVKKSRTSRTFPLPVSQRWPYFSKGATITDDEMEDFRDYFFS